MSFVIDEGKVEELLRAGTIGYTPVSISTIENYRPFYGSMGASGTVFVGRAAASKESRGRLTAIREKIEKSGAPLHSAAELIAEIDEMRGGSR